ncbi:MAG: hypothetical protein QOE61_1413 [Micromonosporaceae bacterium]|nr:hypothetical protein [Micromonosporaceae bacterium]
MRFEITFHSPFRVASGHAGDSADSTVDSRLLLPASSLKGVMRSTARDLLALPAAWLEAVYGTAWQPSPWSWSDAAIDGGETIPPVRSRARIQVDPETATVRRGALAVAQEVLAHGAEFTVSCTGRVAPSDLAHHTAVLVASARAVISLGGDRRRGLGWVSVTPLDPAWSAQPTARWATELVAAIEALPPQPPSTGGSP